MAETGINKNGVHKTPCLILNSDVEVKLVASRAGFID
jgi:hypothetical protein